MDEYILAFDLGTGGNKASLYQSDGTCLCSHFESYPTYFPKPGRHEQKPEEWWKAVINSTKTLIEKSGVRKINVRYMAISGHSMSVVPVDKDGVLLREFVPIWSDTRAVKQAEEFFSRIDYNDWYATTGNGFSRECYAVFKMIWYKDNEADLYSKIYKVLGTKDYINLKLTGKFYTDNSYASGSGVYDLGQRTYKKEFLVASGISHELFPEILTSHTPVGIILPEVAEQMGLSSGVTVMAGGVDNSCMALGAGNLKAGRVYLSLGSSAWIAISSENPVIDLKIKPFVFDHVVPGLYTSATSIFSAGSSFRWLSDVVCTSLKDKALLTGSNVYDLLVETGMESPLGANGVIFNPSFAGAPAAYQNEHVKGAFLGLELRHSISDLIRAVLEGITFDLCLMHRKLEEICSIHKDVVIVGGGSKNRYWRQMFADVFDRTFTRISTDQDAASLGAAAIAAVGAGIWKDYSEIEKVITRLESIEPLPEHVDQYARLLKTYVKTIKYLSDIGRVMSGVND